MMPVHQRGDGSSFIVYGDFYDNGAQIGAPMGGPGMLLFSRSKAILY